MRTVNKSTILKFMVQNGYRMNQDIQTPHGSIMVSARKIDGKMVTFCFDKWNRMEGYQVDNYPYHSV